MRLRTYNPQNMTTLTIPQIEEPTTFWSLPELAQAEIVDSLPQQNTWVLNVVRNDQGNWYFDLPEYNIYNELFVGGTELALDWHYLDLMLSRGLDADLDNAEMEMVVSCNPIEDCTTTLEFLRIDEENEDASYFSDQRSNIVCWLCPMLVYMFKEVPSTLYLDLYPETWESDADA